DLNFIRSVVDSNPAIYLDELQEQLSVACHVNVSIGTLSRILYHLEYSHKAISQSALECDEQLRA
ncbi:hypothetical protein BDY19DRAFT_871676, partial [Irpex rosettiformis]